MLNFVELFVVFVMAASALMYARRHYAEVVYVQSSLDGRRYLVRRLADREEAADLLARTNARLQRLVRHMVATRPGDPDARRLYENYDPDALSEGGTEVGYTSYSVNKGEKIVLCLRQRDDSFVDENVLAYVAVHELGHLMTAEVGHTETFWANFRTLLREAVRIGVYRQEDYARKPAPYCGISITSSVL
jgi:hypothetical protein